MRLIKATNYLDMSRKAANIIFAQIILTPDSVLGLATGSTPLGVYRQLIESYDKGDLDFAATRTVNLDEYVGLSADNTQSYRYYMNINLFNKINIDPLNTYLPDGLASDLQAECSRYDQIISRLGGIDLQLLGIGHDGHIGFNQPGQEFDKMTHVVNLSQLTIKANSRFFESQADVPRQAVTMGIKSIMQARKILVVVSGADKAEILAKVIQGPITPEIPGSIIQLHPDATVIADADARKYLVD